MIETKEQYDEAQFVGDREFSHKVLDPQGLAWTVDTIYDLRETIEALRDAVKDALKKEPQLTLAQTFKDIPDWIKDD